MPSYDEQLFRPAAPVALVTILDPANGDQPAGVPFQIDTGVDATLVPEESITALAVEALAGEGFVLVGFDGTRLQSRVVTVHLTFERRTFKGRFLLTPGAIGIIGRDVLNHVSIRLDGSSLTWDLR